MGRHCIRNTLAKAHTFDTLYTWTTHGKDNEKEQRNKEKNKKKQQNRKTKKREIFVKHPNNC